MKTVYRCSNCGSENVEQKTWVNPNTNDIVEFISMDAEDCYCNDCEDHCDLELKMGKK